MLVDIARLLEFDSPMQGGTFFRTRNLVVNLNLNSISLEIVSFGGKKLALFGLKFTQLASMVG